MNERKINKQKMWQNCHKIDDDNIYNVVEDSITTTMHVLHPYFITTVFRKTKMSLLTLWEQNVNFWRVQK